MSYILFAIAGGIALFALSQLLLRNKRPVHYCVAVAFFSLAYTLFYFGAVQAGFIYRLPALINSDISITFIIAPSIYLFIITMIFEGRQPVENYLHHYILPVIIFTGFAVFNGVSVTPSPEAYAALPGRFEHSGFILFSLSADVFLLFYILLTITRGIRQYRKGAVYRKTEYRILMAFLFLLLLPLSIFLINYIIQDEVLFLLGSLSYGVMGLVFSLISTRMAEYTNGLDGMMITPVQRSMPQWDAEMEAVLQGVHFFIEEKRRFIDPDYKLRDLSQSLGKSPAQVSYSVNRGLGENFRSYVNSVRLDHIKKELIEDSKSSILEIAFRNGFNSKSSFNKIFIHTFGVSPREFRSRSFTPGAKTQRAVTG
ncbi:MAG: AraC family transcriptional regulator [Spirochaetales bacterium]|nr:AraC family transcriptional regulator [Spirochaetales bacterium]